MPDKRGWLGPADGCTCSKRPRKFHDSACPCYTLANVPVAQSSAPAEITRTYAHRLDVPTAFVNPGQDIPTAFPASYESECDTCGSDIYEGDEIRADGSGGWECAEHAEEDIEVTRMREEQTYADAQKTCEHTFTWAAEGSFCTGCGIEDSAELKTERFKAGRDAAPATHTGVPAMRSGSAYMLPYPGSPSSVTDPAQSAADAFLDPTPPPTPEPSVSGQPDPKRDSWGRYLLVGPAGGKAKAFTRATTFAKSISDTYALSQWGKRNVVLGLTMRPDLLALAHGKHVRRDKEALDKIHEQAAETAGNKVAANMGTAVHSFSERLDAGLRTLEEVPPELRPLLAAYRAKRLEAGLVTRPEWIERTTLSTEFGEPVAGTLDRLDQLPDGTHVISDVKTGRDLTYGWQEIAIQLLVYATGVNKWGLYDHRTQTWQEAPEVHEDYALVMHLPVEREDGGPAFCQIYRVDLVQARAAARMCADVRAWRKNRKLAEVWAPPMAPVSWHERFAHASSRGELSTLYTQARDSAVEPMELQRLVQIGQQRLRELENAGG